MWQYQFARYSLSRGEGASSARFTSWRKDENAKWIVLLAIIDIFFLYLRLQWVARVGGQRGMDRNRTIQTHTHTWPRRTQGATEFMLLYFLPTTALGKPLSLCLSLSGWPVT